MDQGLLVVTAVAVIVHLGTALAGAFLKSQTDQAKLAKIDSATTQILSAVTAVAPAVPTTTPKTLAQAATDLANVAQALAAVSSPLASNSGGTGGGGTQNAG